MVYVTITILRHEKIVPFGVKNKSHHENTKSKSTKIFVLSYFRDFVIKELAY